MNDSIFLPKKIKIGFQRRSDTYTQKLAYVIYYDEKGKLRKEKSWDTWRDHEIEPEEYINVPTEGFVLNKKVGGYKTRWDFRQAYIRVYDPRGFEFEITVPNLLYILEHTSSIKGKGLEGKFVYGWSGTELVLLPVSSPDYIQIQELAEKRFKNDTISAKDLKPGFKYRTKDNKEYIYMGYFDGHEYVYKFEGQQFATPTQLENYARKYNRPLYKNSTSHEFWITSGSRDNALYVYEIGCVGKRHFFATEEGYQKFKMWKSVSGKFIEECSDEPVSWYSTLMDELEHITMFSPIDPSRNVVTRCTQEMIDDRTRSGCFGRRFLTQIGNELLEYSIYGHCNVDGPAKFYAQFTYNSKNRKMREFFERSKTDIYGECTVDMTLEEIFKILPPCYLDQYLKNGKYYRRLFYYD